MSNSLQEISCQAEPFEERIDILFRELELAGKWQRPSILFAIYSSEYVHADAALALENRLVAFGQQIFHYQVRNAENSDVAIRLAKIADLEKTIVFVDGLRWGDGHNGSQAYSALNLHREFFIDNRIRIVFWLTENEAVDLAHHASDYWAFRHRVVEFIDSPDPNQILLCALESAWEGTGEYTDTLEDIDAQISLRESLLTDLPKRNESTATYAHLALRLGILHWRKGNYEKAFNFLQTALEISEVLKDKWFEAECFNAVALIQTGRGRVDEAIEAYKQAIRLAPDQIFPWNNLGNLYSQLDRNEEALEAFRKAIEHNPTDAVSWNGLGNVYFKLGLINDALVTYKKAIEISPNFVYPWNGLGNVFASTGRVEEAIASYQNAVGFNNRLLSAWLGLGRIFAQQRRSGEALQAYQKAVEIDPKNFWVWNEIGNLYFKMGTYGDAVSAYDKAIERAPASAWLYNNLALAYCHQGKYAGAIHLYKKSVELLRGNNEKAILLIRIGDACRRMGDTKSAMAAYQRAIDFGADSAWFGGDLDAAPYSLIPVGQIPAHLENRLNGSTPALKEVGKFVASSPVHEPPESTATRFATSPDVTPTESPINHPGEFEEEPKGNATGTMEQPLADEATSQAVLLEAEQAENWAGAQYMKNTTETPLPEAGSMVGAERISDEDENPAENEPRNAHEWNELGNTHFKADCYEEAIIAYTKAVELSPGFNWPYINNLALAYHHKSNHKGDETDARPVEAVTIQTADGGAPVDELSPVVQEGHHGSEAENGESPATEVSADTRQAELTFEEQDNNMGEHEDISMDYRPPAASINLIEEAFQEDSHYRPRGGTQYEQKIIENKIPSLSKKERPSDAVRIPVRNETGEGEFVPANAEEWNELGNIYLRSRAYDKAISAFTSAIALDALYGWSYSNLALAYCHKRRFAEAIPLYQKSIQLLKSNKEKAVSWNRLGDAYRRLNEHNNAKMAYQRAAELDSNVNSLKTRARFVLLGNRRS